MKNAGRNILAICLVALVAALYAVVLTANRARADVLTCQGVKVAIPDSSRLKFVSVSDIDAYLEEYGPCVGENVQSIDLRQIESILADKSAILDAEAYLDREGYLRIEIHQREPVVRFQKDGNGFYADEKGYIFPLHPGYTSQIPVIDGAIPLKTGDQFKGRARTEQERSWVEDILQLVKYMKETAWNHMISEISVQENGNLVLYPEKGKERFLFGAPKGVEAKFDRMEMYYKAIAANASGKKYDLIDVRFDKQIICK